jgi:hypothetical protein
MKREEIKKELDRIWHKCETMGEYKKKIDSKILDMYSVVEDIKNPYPESVFKEPSKNDYNKINKIIKGQGLSIDGYNGAWGRRVFNNTKKDIRTKFNNLIKEGKA